MTATVTLLSALPTVLDIEASGFGRGSYPIEVGLALPDGSTFCSLIAPAQKWVHWDPQAEALHHITPAILASHGKPLAEIALTLNQRLRGVIVYSDGWANDFSWLGLLFDEADLVPAFKLENLRALLSDEQAALWHAAKTEVLAATSQERHRASIDARVIQQTLARVRERAPQAH
jgi:hypothetical protein